MVDLHDGGADVGLQAVVVVLQGGQGVGATLLPWWWRGKTQSSGGEGIKMTDLILLSTRHNEEGNMDGLNTHGKRLKLHKCRVTCQKLLKSYLLGLVLFFRCG